jgi:hypothetical protein
MVASGIVLKEALFINFQEKKFMNKILAYNKSGCSLSE